MDATEAIAGQEVPKTAITTPSGRMDISESTGVPDMACEGEVSSWNSGMNPDEIHRKISPDCLPVKDEEARHNPMRPPEEMAKVEPFFTKKSKEIHVNSRNTSIVQQPTNSCGKTTPILVNLRKPKLFSGPHEGSLESLSSSPPTIDYNDMGFEQSRLRSFAHWPKSDIIQPSDLARAGMFFIGPGDRVQCAFCKGKLEGWIRGGNPLEEHKKHFGARCRFMQGAQVDNIPIAHGGGTGTTQPRNVTAPSSPSITTDGHMPDANALAELAIDIKNGHDCSSPIGDTVPMSSSPGVSNMTSSLLNGDSGDTCDGMLHDWQPEDDPCHRIQTKDPEFVETAFSSFGDLLAGDKTELTQTRNVTASSSSPVTTTRPSVQVARQPSYPEYADEQKRLDSFPRDTDMGQRPRQLAEVGFFFASLVRIQCYACGGCVSNWVDYMDDLWLVHAAWFPHCAHVMKKRPELLTTNETDGVSLQMYIEKRLKVEVSLPRTVIAQEVGSAPQASTEEDDDGSTVDLHVLLPTEPEDISNSDSSSQRSRRHTVRRSIKRRIGRCIRSIARCICCCCVPKTSDATRNHSIQMSWPDFYTYETPTMQPMRLDTQM